MFQVNTQTARILANYSLYDMRADGYVWAMTTRAGRWVYDPLIQRVVVLSSNLGMSGRDLLEITFTQQYKQLLAKEVLSES